MKLHIILNFALLYQISIIFDVRLFLSLFSAPAEKRVKNRRFSPNANICVKNTSVNVYNNKFCILSPNFINFCKHQFFINPSQKMLTKFNFYHIFLWCCPIGQRNCIWLTHNISQDKYV